MLANFPKVKFLVYDSLFLFAPETRRLSNMSLIHINVYKH